VTADTRIPVTIVTGFLGSGKTTLLRRLLASGAVRNVAILVNELAAIGVDQRLLAGAGDVQLLENGCICCAVRDDLRRSLAALLERPPGEAISQVVIETTGLADPAPILATFMSDAALGYHFRIGTIIAVVDCVNAAAQLASHRECANQIAAADRIVLGKEDLADRATIAATRAALARLNPVAPIVSGAMPEPDLAAALLTNDDARDDEPARLRRLIAANLPAARAFGESVHAPCIAAFCIAVDGAFDWSAFGLWLTMLLHAHGERVLRVKGILNIEGAATPVLVNGVQRLMHRPEHLSAWPDEDRRSILVFIVEGLDPEAIRQSFDALVR
jgi:G3E family GTPase